MTPSVGPLVAILPAEMPDLPYLHFSPMQDELYLAKKQPCNRTHYLTQDDALHFKQQVSVRDPVPILRSSLSPGSRSKFSPARLTVKWLNWHSLCQKTVSSTRTTLNSARVWPSELYLLPEYVDSILTHTLPHLSKPYRRLYDKCLSTCSSFCPYMQSFLHSFTYFSMQMSKPYLAKPISTFLHAFKISYF